MAKICKVCGRQYLKNPNINKRQWERSTCCSVTCFNSTKLGTTKTPEQRQHISDGMLGHPVSDSTRAKLSALFSRKPKESIRGEKNPRWKGGITPENRKARKSLEYAIWRDAVFNRDDYRCYDCGARGVSIQAHHIYPFAQFPRLRLMIENGQTLCKPCHKQK